MHIDLSESGLFHLALYPSVSSMLLQMTGFPSFLRLNNIPFCMYVYIYMYNKFLFIQLPLYRLLGYSHIFAIVNNATINKEVQISL